MMISIYTESKFLQEKNYVFHVIFREILGIDYRVFDTSVSKSYKIVFSNGRYVEFCDTFFSNIPESIGYCDRKFLPERLSELKSVLPDEVIPFFYGNNTYTERINGSVYCGGDAIGTAFFMLSRWEELVCCSYDRWDRFPEKEAYAVKFGTIQKPVVHMYAELIRYIAKKFNIDIPQKHTFEKTLTHDIDFLYKWVKPCDFVKTCVSSLFKRFSLREFNSFCSFHQKGQDPYDVYDYLMDLSEKNNYKSTFYFLNTKYNMIRLETGKGKQIIDSIIRRKHNIGIHSNYFLTKDINKIQEDLSFYENLFNRKITTNRQHYLKIRIPQTLLALEQIGILQDSSLYFTNNPGFRTGMCIEHSLFDCEKREIMKIKELPLTLMDVSLQRARKYGEALEWIDNLMNVVKKYNGNFVCLWHNSSFNSIEWEYIRGIYEYIVTGKNIKDE